MSHDLHIRDFEPRDLAAVLALNVRAMEADADPRESAKLRPELLNIPENFQQDGAFLVGTIDEELVAMGSVRPESGMSYRVNFVRVAIDHQRSGIARRLMAALEARARDLGATAIVLDTTVEQVAAQRLYAAIGYTETHRSTVTYETYGQTFEVVNYRKTLDDLAPPSDAVEVEEWQWQLLQESRVGRLATIAADGRPHLVPVVYALVDEGIAIAIDEKPKRSTRLARLRNIERDPRVTLLVDRYDDDWSQLAWVRVDGSATILERGDEYPEALEALRERYPQHHEMALEGLPLIVIEPERVVGWRATES
jgi:PPOX class probable F420-dependent enzyme